MEIIKTNMSLPPRLSTSDILPHNVAAGPETREFLQQVVDVLLDFVKASNDRNEKVLEFHHPEEMKRLLDLDVPDSALPLQQLVQDCATTLKYQVKTGEYDGEVASNTAAVLGFWTFHKNGGDTIAANLWLLLTVS